jgi:hypothetical protein
MRREEEEEESEFESRFGEFGRSQREREGTVGDWCPPFGGSEILFQ